MAMREVSQSHWIRCKDEQSLSWCNLAKHPSAVHEINESSSSSRKRKREQHEMQPDNVRHQLVRNTQRVSSRDMMPPPPPQIQQHREIQSQAAPLAAPRPTQHHEAYNPDPNVPSPRRQNRETQHSSRPNETRAQDLSNPPVRLYPTVVDHPHDSYRHQANRPLDHRQSMPFATHDYPLESSFDTRHNPAVERQAYASHPAAPQSFEQNDGFIYTRHEASQQQQRKETREPLRPVNVNATGLQTPKRTSYLRAGPKAMLSPSRAAQPTAGSVSSPFFQREPSTSHIASTHRPPPRGGDMSQTHEQRGHQLGATGNSQWLHESSTRSNLQDRARLHSQLQPSSGYGTFGPASSSATLPYRGLTAASQASGDLRSRYDNQAYGSSSREPLVERRHVPASRARITLPPSKASSQDYELSSIRGLRGGYPQPADGFSSYHSSGYTGSRPLFSAASRRSVRR